MGKKKQFSPSTSVISLIEKEKLLAYAPLTYQESSNESQYNANGLGVWEVERVLRNEAKTFRQPASTQMQAHPKRLVFCDPTYPAWPPAKKADMQRCFEILLNAGYEIYGLDKRGLSYELIRNAEYCLSYPDYNDIMPLFTLSQEEILQSNPTLRKTPGSQLGILDAFAVNNLLAAVSPDYEASSRLEVGLEIARVLGIYRTNPLNMIHRGLDASHPEGVHWIVRRSSELQNDEYRELSEMAPQKVTCRIQEIDVRDYANAKGTPYSEILSRGFDSAYTGRITLVLRDNRNMGDKTAIQEAINTLISDCNKRENEKELIFTNMNFEKSETNTKYVNVDLTKMKNVRALNFTHCTNVHLILEQIEQNYSNLESLTISGLNAEEAKILNKILPLCTSLKALVLTNCKLGELDAKVFQNLKSLEKVDLSSSEIRDAVFIKVVGKKKSQSLREVNVSNSSIKGLGGENDMDVDSPLGRLVLDSEGKNWLYNRETVETVGTYTEFTGGEYDNNHLEKINLRDMQFTANEVSTLINCSKSVETLDLRNADLGKIELDPNLQLKKLKNLSAKISGLGDLETILKHCPELKVLKCEKDFYFSEHGRMITRNAQGILKDGQVLSIEELDIDSPSRWMTLDEMILLLNAMPNIKKLIVGDLVTSEGEPGFRAVNHGAFKEIEIVEIGTGFEIALFDQMPKLRTLVIGSDLKFEGLKEIAPLYALENLTIKSMHLHENLFDVLKKTPNLKSLKSSLSDGWIGEVPDDLELNFLEVLDISQDRLFTVKLLCDLIKKAPNLREIRMGKRQDLADLFYQKDLGSVKRFDIRGIALEQSVLDYRNAKTDNSLIYSPDKVVPPTPSIPPVSVARPEMEEPGDIKDKQESSFDLAYLFETRTGVRPAPSTYRLSVYNTVRKNPGVYKRGEGSPFTFLNTGDPDYRECPEIQLSQDSLLEKFQGFSDEPSDTDYCRGKFPLMLSQEYSAIPSLSANQRITDLSIPGLSPEDYEIVYSKRDDFYYIRLLHGQARNVNVECLLTVPLIYAPMEQNEALRRQYAAKNNLDLPEEYTQGDAEYWENAYIETKAGACRHKAHAFFIEIGDKVYRKRIVRNSCHRYVELQEFEGADWVQCDLGGHSADLRFHKSPLDEKTAPLPEPKPPEVPINPAFVVKVSEIKEDRSPSDYAKSLLEKYPGKKVFVDFNSDPAVDAFQALLRDKAHHDKRPIFYIDSPDDIHCQGPRIQRNPDNSGTLLREAGGDLYDFLKANQPGSVLVVNWNRFTTEEIIKFNSLLDDERRADGEKIPNEMTIIGLYNSHRMTAYQGSDFTSRFNHQLKAPYTAPQINAELSEQPEGFAKKKKRPVFLHRSTNWQTILCGEWKLSSQGLTFIEGPFIQALKTGECLELIDAPWDDDEFVKFMDKVRIDRAVTIAGIRYQIPENFGVTEGPDYDLKDHLEGRVSVQLMEKDSGLPSNSIVLNPATFTEFYQTYQLEGKDLVSTPGLFSGYQKDETLTLYLSSPLFDDQWGQLIEEAENKQVKLSIIARDKDDLPAALSALVKPDELLDLEGPGQFALNIIQTPNAKLAIDRLKKTMNNPIIIDITDLEYSDLFGKIEYHLPEQGFYQFQQSLGAVNQAFAQGREVIFKGNPSPTMSQMLARWANQTDPGEHKITLVTSAPNPELIPLSSIQKINDPKPEPVQAGKIEEIDFEDFLFERTAKLDLALKEGPFTLITGKTGAGKSTFALEHLSKHPRMGLHKGLDSLSEWAQPLEPGQKFRVLFLDEANISEDKKQEWTLFAGLLDNDPPQIIINGETRTLSKGHKVVFAGNPQSYGGERRVPRLFKDYPVTTLTFKPIDPQHLVKAVLKPILGKREDFKELSDHIINVYSYVQDIAGENSWITPRELTHMAHLILAHLRRNPSLDPLMLASQAAYTVAQQVLPPASQHLLLPPYGVSPLSWPTPATKPLEDYLITENRKPIESRLNEFLAIRQMKRENQLRGGLGGMILEGEPGAGKSVHVIKQLEALGFKEGKDYYRLPVAMGFSQKKELLTKAYKEGAIVIIDEINTSPAMEKFFNGALSGQLEGVDPAEVKPGFLLIGTQNPVKMEGRRAMSQAMQRRLLHCPVPDYTHDEMVQILVTLHKLPHAIADEVVSDFERANKNNNPPMTFRSFLGKFKEAIPFIGGSVPARVSGMKPDAMNQRIRELFDYLVQTQPRVGVSSATARAVVVSPDKRRDEPELPQNSPDKRKIDK